MQNQRFFITLKSIIIVGRLDKSKEEERRQAKIGFSVRFKREEFSRRTVLKNLLVVVYDWAKKNNKLYKLLFFDQSQLSALALRLTADIFSGYYVYAMRQNWYVNVSIIIISERKFSLWISDRLFYLPLLCNILFYTSVQFISHHYAKNND